MEEIRLAGRVNRRSYTANRDQLEHEAPSLLDAESISVRPVKPSQPNSRIAADVTFRFRTEDGEVEEFPISGLNEGESVLIPRGIRVQLKKGAGGMPRWLTLMIVLAFLGLLAAFCYLYART